MKKPRIYAALAAIIFLVSAAGATQAGALGSTTEDALLRALDDERHAQAVYQAVIDRHGEIRPFSNVIRAEERHESFLVDLFKKYEIAIPRDPWPDRALEAPATLREACAQAVEAEKANLEMYDELLELVTEPDVRDIFMRLRDSSEERHLPAFERCSESNRSRSRGRGRGGR